MAIQAINTIKSWFRTGFIPTQEQFWDVFDSYRHKQEKVSVTDVEGIDNLISDVIQVINNHETDENAHQNLLSIARIIPYGEVLVFKTSPEGNPKTKEIDDFCLGYVNGTFICGTYLGDNNYDNKTELEL